MKFVDHLPVGRRADYNTTGFYLLSALRDEKRKSATVQEMSQRTAVHGVILRSKYPKTCSFF